MAGKAFFENDKGIVNIFFQFVHTYVSRAPGLNPPQSEKVLFLQCGRNRFVSTTAKLFLNK